MSGKRFTNHPRPAVYEALKARLKSSPRAWLVTGAAGFIGSNLVETLLRLNQRVVALDNFATGKRENLAQLRQSVTAAQWQRFRFIKGDIRDASDCRRACKGIQIVLHQAALGSVPRSMADPLASHAANVTGFVNMLEASRQARVKRFVYASSSSVYGDSPRLPKVEERIGQPLSPYAATKLIDEIYAQVFARAYGLETVGLRYFNVFGPRQDPEGAYAAVIPKWISALLHGAPVPINGDGRTSRDFCYIDNVVQANLLAATTKNPGAINEVFNVAVGERASLNELFRAIKTELAVYEPSVQGVKPVYGDFRAGDVRHSLADIGKAKKLLGYRPAHRMEDGLKLAMEWYWENTK